MILVVLGTLPYESHWQIGLMEAFARHHLVVYVAPDVGYAPANAAGTRWDELARSLASESSAGLVRVTLRAFWPGSRFHRISQWNRWAGMRRLLRQLASHDHRETVLIVQSPHQLPTLRGLRARLRVYEVVDDYVSLAASRHQARHIGAAHRRMLSQCDVVLATSATLADDIRRTRPDVEETTNGIEYETFSVARGAATATPLDGIPRPRIGVIGKLNDRIDWELLGSICAEQPDWHIVAVGPLYQASERTTSAVRRLTARPNFHLVAPVDREGLAPAIAAMDVCLIPYRLTKTGLAINPLKLYQYLAVGKPVVSSWLPQVARFRDIVQCCDGAPSFVAAITQALRDAPDERACQTRQARAREFDWVTVAGQRLQHMTRRMAAAGPE